MSSPWKNILGRFYALVYYTTFVRQSYVNSPEILILLKLHAEAHHCTIRVKICYWFIFISNIIITCSVTNESFFLYWLFSSRPESKKISNGKLCNKSFLMWDLLKSTYLTFICNWNTNVELFYYFVDLQKFLMFWKKIWNLLLPPFYDKKNQITKL